MAADNFLQFFQITVSEESSRFDLTELYDIGENDIKINGQSQAAGFFQPRLGRQLNQRGRQAGKNNCGFRAVIFMCFKPRQFSLH